jgi:hypothetical protein
MTAIEDRLRDLRRSVSPPDLPTADQVARRGRHRRSTRRAVRVVSVLTVLALVPVIVVRLSGDGGEGRVVSGAGDALATVRAAVGRTSAAGSYEVDLDTTMTQSGPTYRFTGHAIVNLDPYAMVSETNSPSLGAITTHVNATHVWQLGGATVGYGPGTPGVSLADYSSQVVGTLGRGPGALAMISLASRGGYLNLEEEAVASAEPGGTGTAGDVPVTYYDVNIDLTRLADAPNLSDMQRQTIAAALPLLDDSGYSGTTERIGVDDMGYVREINSTTNFDDGSSTVRHSVLSKFGCAPKVYMPNETPPPTTEPTACATTTTGSASTAASPTTTGSPSSTTSSSSTPPTEGPALPSFRPAPGWHTSEPGTGGMLVTAANVPLGPDALEGNYPAWGSIGRLQEGEILMQASFMAPLESWADDAARGYPPSSLPLSLDEAPSNYGFEGQPDHVYTERVGATVNGWNIDVLISYGGGDPTAVPPVRAQPSAGTRAAAQEQLARLVVPLPPARSG